MRHSFSFIILSVTIIPSFAFGWEFVTARNGVNGDFEQRMRDYLDLLDQKLTNLERSMNEKFAEIGSSIKNSENVQQEMKIDIGSSLRKLETLLEEMKADDKFSRIDSSLATGVNVLEDILDKQGEFGKSLLNKTQAYATGFAESMAAMKVLEWNLEQHRQEVDAKLTNILATVEQFDQQRVTVNEISTQAPISIPTTPAAQGEDSCCKQPRNCSDVQIKHGGRRSGIYTIYPVPCVPVSVNVFCDLSTNGGGWTVFQVRGAKVPEGQNRTDFYRNWTEYENGFGSVEQDYWLGLRNLFVMCVFGDCELRVELMDWNTDNRYANYRIFTLSGPEDRYRAGFSGYVGDAGSATMNGDSLAYHNGIQFSTFDVDNDPYKQNGANKYKGAWWYRNGHQANLNGIYHGEETKGISKYSEGLTWFQWRGDSYSMKMTQIKVRSRYLFSYQKAAAWSYL